MSIPDYQTVMLPLLKQIADRQEHPLPKVIDALAAEFKLTDAERRDLLRPAVDSSSSIIESGGLGPT